MKERNDDFSKRRENLKDLSDKELKKYFYELADKIVDPLVKMGFDNTSKSIERSVLLRMGFSSLECKGIVDLLSEHDLLQKGAGHCVYKIAKDKALTIRQAGIELGEGKHVDYLKEVFKLYG